MVGIRIEGAKSGVGKRVIRRPQHTFQIRTKAWVIQPFLIAPVLPGETMKSLMFQARCVTDPIANALVGWWNEYYFFYVKHRDLAIRDDATEMMINPAFDLDTAQAQALSIPHYHSTAGISWTHHCLQRVVEEYFRNENEDWDEFTIDVGSGAMPVASVGRDTALDSAVLESIEDDVDIDLTDAGSQAGVAVMASEVEAALQQWQFARMNNLTDMTYEDYLKSYGVTGAAVIEPHKPELIRFIREWTYPTNTINPSDGAPSSACSWAIAEKADKDRFFREPGFIFGVTVKRPKIYFKKMDGNIVDLMNSAMTWLPAVLENEMRVGRVSISGAAKPFVDIGAEVIIDVRDLLLYGDQYLNYAMTGNTSSFVTLPDDAGGPFNKAYAEISDQNALFIDSAGPDVLIREDGVVNLQIATRQIDTTPTTASINA